MLAAYCQSIEDLLAYDAASKGQRAPCCQPRQRFMRKGQQSAAAVRVPVCKCLPFLSAVTSSSCNHSGRLARLAPSLLNLLILFCPCHLLLSDPSDTATLPGASTRLSGYIFISLAKLRASLFTALMQHVLSLFQMRCIKLF